MQKFETYIFDEFYTGYDHASDPNKDEDGRGTMERFCAVIGAVIDSMVPFIEDFPKNAIEPKTMVEQMVSYSESEMGYTKDWDWFYTLTMGFRRHLRAIMPYLYTIRGTIPAHEIMFSWLGMSFVITEDFSYVTGFDSTLDFDTPVRRLDSGNYTCSGYEVALTGPVLDFTAGYSTQYSNNYFHPDNYLNAIYTILLFNQPINADLTAITYNGDDLSAYFADEKYSKLNRKFS